MSAFNSRPPFFVVVAGTDTGVGKTFTTCALAHRLTREGVRTIAVKPVETGIEDDPSGGEDGELLAEATGQAGPLRALERYRAPLAAPAAAELENRTIDFDRLVGEVTRVAAGADVALIEGAGGLLSPLSWNRTVRDLARALGAPLLLVAADRLGSLNQVRLAAEAVQRGGVELLGVVLSGGRRDDRAANRNLADLRRVEPGLRIERLPEVGGLEEAAQLLGPVGRWIEEALEAGATGSRAR